MKTVTGNLEQRAANSIAQNNANGQPKKRGGANGSQLKCLPPGATFCAFCGDPIQRKTATGREPKYCSGRCRSAAFRARQREKREC